MPLRFTLRQLEYLVTVGDCGSISEAAARLNVSSPSISSAIAQLETEFGLPLFVRRHAQGLSPTQSGHRMIAGARQVLEGAAGLNILAGDIAGLVRGPLNVGCLVTFAQIVLPRLRRGFCDAHPAVAFHQFERDQTELFDALHRAELDVAMSYDMEIPSDLDFVPLASLPPYVLLPEAHPLAEHEAVSVTDLAAHPMILLDLPMSADYFLSFFEAQGLSPEIAERTRDFAVMRSLVANGFGYSIANIRYRSDLAPDGRRLRHVPLVGAPRPMRLGLLTARGARSSMTVRAFIDHCTAEVAGGEVPGLAPLPPERC
ncbi:LysR family transcriptional regulator [Salipiger sp.]|uniref:LysR family transcriptional regulator n=1 Tax=Salipiger sp. TaxID=2078585 RepID=UPI003A96B6A2